MRPAELMLLAAVLAAIVLPYLRVATRSALTAAATLVMAVAALVHISSEGARWQLTPLYLAAATVTVAVLVDLARTRDHRLGRVGAIVLGLLALLGGVVGWSLPIPTLPAPDGPHAVGTQVVGLVDEERADRYGPDPIRSRQLVLQVWYPADPEAPQRPGAWAPAGASFGREAARWLGLPPFVLDHVGLVDAHATSDAPATPEPGALPVVVYSHGWGGFRTIQSDLAESLASHGYVVAALDHTHGAVATVFPDGEVVPVDPSALPHGTTAEIEDAASERLVETFADDLAFLLDELEDGAVPMLDGRLDLTRVGFVGHSTGGGAAVRLCASDDRCAAVVGLDPWVQPVPDMILGAGLDLPFLSLRSEEWAGNGNDARLRRLHASSPGPSGLVVVEGTTHRDVTMLPFLSPLSSRFGLVGVTPGERTHELTNAWTTRWFDHHLLGTRSDPLADPPPFPEAHIDG